MSHKSQRRVNMGSRNAVSLFWLPGMLVNITTFIAILDLHVRIYSTPVANDNMYDSFYIKGMFAIKVVSVSSVIIQ